MLFNNFIFTLSTFTRIPTPNIDYNDDNTKYSLLFLPIVGIVLGAIYYFVYNFLYTYLDNALVISILMIVVNLLVTGGIHYDGFLDSTDAMKSYRDKKDKLRIIKDSRIGAFALIHFTILILLNIAANYYVIEAGVGVLFFIYPIISRTVTLMVIKYSTKEKDDMLEALHSTYFDKYLFVPIFISLIVIICYPQTQLNIFTTTNFILIFCLLIVGAIIYAFVFTKMYKKHFDNMNGDLCGFFIVMSELILVITSAIFLI